MTRTLVHWHRNLSVEKHTLMKALVCPQTDEHLDKHTRTEKCSASRASLSEAQGATPGQVYVKQV